MKTIEILAKDDIVNNPQIQRVSDSAAALAVLQGIAVYTTKSRWKNEVRNKKMQELQRVEKEKFAAIGKQTKEPMSIRVADGKVRKPHFKKGKPHGNRTGKGQAGQDH